MRPPDAPIALMMKNRQEQAGFLSEHFAESPEADFKIEPDGPVMDIIKVVVHPVIHIFLIFYWTRIAEYLCQTRYSRLDAISH